MKLILGFLIVLVTSVDVIGKYHLYIGIKDNEETLLLIGTVFSSISFITSIVVGIFLQEIISKKTGTI